MNIKDKTMDRFWAGGFLFNPARSSVFLHKRDSKARVNPNTWAFFGGLNEGVETFGQCFVRELHEEIGLRVSEDEIIPLCEYLNTDLDTYRVVFYVESNVDPSDLVLGEGAGFAWVPLSKLGDFDLTAKTREDLNLFTGQRKRV